MASRPAQRRRRRRTRLGDGELLLLENTRFHPGEEKNDPELSRRLCRAGRLLRQRRLRRGAPRARSTVGVAAHLRPAVAGLLMEKELEYLGGALANPQRPFVAILGGAKISGKIDVIEALLPKVDALLVGGAMACTFYRADGTGNREVAGRARPRRPRARPAGACADAARPCRTIASSPPRWTSLTRRTSSSATRSRLTKRCSISGPTRSPSYAAGHRDGARPCSGTDRWASSRLRRSTTARRVVADAMAEATSAGAQRSSVAATPRRPWQQAGLAPADESRVDRRRCVARVSRGKDAPRRRSAGRSMSRLRRPVFAANWKMHHGPTDAREFMHTFLATFPAAFGSLADFLPAGGNDPGVCRSPQAAQRDLARRAEHSLGRQGSLHR